jgi:hypothetical protein
MDRPFARAPVRRSLGATPVITRGLTTQADSAAYDVVPSGVTPSAASTSIRVLSRALSNGASGAGSATRPDQKNVVALRPFSTGIQRAALVRFGVRRHTLSA